MAYCPNCNFEYRPEVTRCPDCGEDLLPGSPPPPKPEPSPRDTEPVLLCRVPDPTEAEIIRAALSEAGIRCILQEHGPITARLTRVADGATHDYALIFVATNRLDEARRVLAQIQSGSVEWPQGMEPDEEEGED